MANPTRWATDTGPEHSQWYIDRFRKLAAEGADLAGEARLVHGGRMTQVWDAEAVNRTTGKTMALFRCTQMILHPR